MILPRPSDAFTWIDTASGPALVCRPLAPFAHHVFTSRPWPLGVVPDGDGAGGWDEVARAVGADASRLLRARQPHGAAFVAHHAGQPMAPRADADILISGEARVAAAVQSADCVPLLIADTRTHVVAAAHAGWRGLAQRVPVVTVEAMEAEFGSRASKLVAAVGPSIGPCCYEVGGDVRDRFAASGFSSWDLTRWFTRTAHSLPNNPSLPALTAGARDGRWFFDMWTATRDQLRGAGVREDRIFLAELCTASHPEVFCSYRRDGGAAGRMAAAIRRLGG